MRVLIDTNVLLDYLLTNKGFAETAKEIFELISNEEMGLDGYIAPHTVTNSFYIMRKKYGDSKTRDLLLKATEILSIEDLAGDDILAALTNYTFSDFEDGVQYECAKRCNAQYIITRDPKGFEYSEIPVISPADFIRLMKE